MYIIYLNGELFTEISAKSAHHALRKIRRVMPNSWNYTIKGCGERVKMTSVCGANYTARRIG